MKTIPNVLSETLSAYNVELLRNEGRFLNRAHSLPRTLPEWERRRAKVKAAVWRLAGVSHDPSVPLDPVYTGEFKRDGYTVKSVHYQTRMGVRATASLFIPDGEGPFPAVLNLHGHNSEGRRFAFIQSRGHILAKSGYVCLSVDTWGMGERSTEHEKFEYHGSTLGGGLFLLGESLLGGLLVDNMRSVDFLSSLPFVDSARIGVMGESGGGNQTMWVGAMDDRLKAVMPIVSVGSFESYVAGSNCYCEVLPGGFREFEEDAILSLVAPRGLKMLNALYDCNPTFYVPEMMRTYKRAREVFALCGAEQNISFTPFDTEHGFKPGMSDVVLGFFDLFLKGEGNGNPRMTPPFETLPFRDIAVFKAGTRPAQFGSISDYCTARFAELRKRGASPLPSLADEQASLRKVLRIGECDGAVAEAVPLGAAGTADTSFNVRYMPVDASRLDYTERIGAIGEDGASFTRWLLRNPRGLAVPCLVRDSAEPGATTYILATSNVDGKQTLAGNPRLDALVADSAARIVVIDLFATGENAIPELNAPLGDFHTAVRALMWLDRSLVGEWTSCYAMAASFARERFGAGKVVFFGVGEAGVAAMAATVLGRPADVAFEGQDVPESFAWAEGEIRPARWRSLAECIVGFAVWGDVARIKASLAQ